jgi:hypothetical protein
MYKTGYQRNKRKLYHAQSLTPGAKEEHLDELSLIGEDRSRATKITLGCSRRHLNNTRVWCLNSWIISRKESPPREH